MIRISIILSLTFIILNVHGQVIPFITARMGASYTNMKFVSATDFSNQNIKGPAIGSSVGIGILPSHNASLGAKISFGYQLLPSKPDLQTLEYRKQTKVIYTLFSRFDYKEFSIQPFVSVNSYLDNSHIYKHKKSRFEFGSAFIFRKERVWYSLQLQSFPEYDFLLPYSRIENYYRKSSLHLPFLSIGMNYLFGNQDKINQTSGDAYYNKNRPFSIEVNYHSLTTGFGLRYHFPLKEGKKKSHEIGFRAGAFITEYSIDFFIIANLYFSSKRNLVNNIEKHYKLNWGFEYGASVGLSDIITPFPHFMGFVENEFTRYYVRIGVGTGFYGTIGFKI